MACGVCQAVTQAQEEAGQVHGNKLTEVHVVYGNHIWLRKSLSQWLEHSGNLCAWSVLTVFPRHLFDFFGDQRFF